MVILRPLKSRGTKLKGATAFRKQTKKKKKKRKIKTHLPYRRPVQEIDGKYRRGLSVQNNNGDTETIKIRRKKKKMSHS